MLNTQAGRLDLKEYIRDIPDFPIPGILFRDITPLLRDGPAFRQAVDDLMAPFAHEKIDAIAAVEARGYVLAAPLAYKLGVGLIPVRKPGKLPYSTISQEYTLEYGKNTLEVHHDACQPGQRVLIVDDLIATGGSARATAQLIERLGASVLGFAFLVELGFLNGRQVLDKYRVHSVLNY
jgi:adenine phosphoribosyltransferase